MVSMEQTLANSILQRRVGASQIEEGSAAKGKWRVEISPEKPQDKCQLMVGKKKTNLF